MVYSISANVEHFYVLDVIHFKSSVFKGFYDNCAQ